jgi:hypothetical protein
MPNENSRRLAGNSLFRVLFCVFWLFSSGLASAALINGGFSSGFTGWQGEVATFDNGTFVDSGLVAVDPGLVAANYSPVVNGITLTTSQVGLVDTYFVSLFQDFTIDSIALGNTLGLSLDVVSNLTSVVDDLAAVQLTDLGGGLPVLDLSAGGMFDVTAWVGATARLAILVSDGDFQLPESITVTNIAFTERSGRVPAPAPCLLIGIGLLAMRRIISR